MRVFLIAAAPLIATACGPNSTPNATRAAPAAITAGPADLVLQPSHEHGPNGLTLSVRTNLPDGTEMNATIVGRPSSPTVFGQDRATVTNGQARFGPYTWRGTPYRAGRYRFQISAPLTIVQPEAVRAQLGDDYSNFRSPLIRQGGGDGTLSGAHISTDYDFTL